MEVRRAQGIPDEEEEEEVALLLSVPATTTASRTATPSPLASESGTRFHSTTPATSLAETHSDESSMNGKRSLCKMLGDGLVSSTGFKRSKVEAEQVQCVDEAIGWSQPVLAEEPVPAESLVKEKDLVVLVQPEPAAGAHGSLLLENEIMPESPSLEELVDEAEEQIPFVEEEVGSPSPPPDDIPLSVNGFTVVRMSSEESTL